MQAVVEITRYSCPIKLGLVESDICSISLFWGVLSCILIDVFDIMGVLHSYYGIRLLWDSVIVRK